MPEFRQDPVSGDWVIIAPERAKRPDQLSPKRPKRVPAPKATCPFEFENLAKGSEWPPIFPAKVDKSTKIVVVPNKYPIVSSTGTCESSNEGTFYHTKDGGGVHNLLITRDHSKNFADIEEGMAIEIFKVFRAQYHLVRNMFQVSLTGVCFLEHQYGIPIIRSFLCRYFLLISFGPCMAQNLISRSTIVVSDAIY